MFILSRFDRIVTEDILTYIYIRFRECSKCWKCWTMEIVYFERVRRREGVERAEGRRHSTRHYVSCIQIFFFSSSFQPRAVCIIIPEQLYAHRLFSPLPRPRSLGAIVIFAAAFFLRCASLSLRANRRRGRFLTARLESRNMNA